MSLTTIAKALVYRAPAVLTVVAVLTFLSAMMIPKLSADFTPSDLFASFEGQAELEAEVREHFQAIDNIVVILVEGDDITTRDALQWQHSLSQSVAELASVESVATITNTPIPRLLPVDPSAARPADDSQDSEADQGQLRALSRALLARGAEGEDMAAEVPSDASAAAAAPHWEADNAPIIVGDDISEEAAARLREALEDADMIRGRLFSANYKLAILAINLNRELTRAADLQASVEEIRVVLRENPPPDGLNASLSGLPAIRMVVVERMREDQAILLPASIIVSLLLLFAAFKWWVSLVLPIFSVSVGTIWLVGGMAATGEPFNIINNIVPMMMVIIGISNAIHVMSRFGEELRQGYTVPEATWRSIAAMLVACFLTSITTAVGFASLGVSTTPILARFGVTAGIGVMLVYVSSMLVLAATLRYLPRPGKNTLISTSGMIENLAAKVTGASARNARWVFPLSVLILLITASAVFVIDVDSAVLDQFKRDDPIAINSRLLEAELGGFRPMDILIKAEDESAWEDPELAAALERVVTQASELDVVLDASSHLDILRRTRMMIRRDPNVLEAPWTSADLRTAHLITSNNAPAALHSYLAADKARGRIQLRVADAGAKATLAAGRSLESILDGELRGFEGLSWHLTGDAWIASLGLRLVIEDLISSISVAFLIIFGFLAVLLRSLRLGLLSILPNILPITLTVTWMALRGIELNTATAIIFSISIGMAVDGTIHMLVRYREERKKHKDAITTIEAAARGTGRAIFMTCTALSLGFGVMMFSSFRPIQLFGELIAVTITGVLFSTMLVLPALMRLWADPPSLRQ